MTPQQFAAMLHGREYRREMTRAEEDQAKELGLVVVFGASDDLIEFRGAIRDEGDCYNGGTIKIDAKGILPDFDNIEDEEEMADYFKRKYTCAYIEAVWSPEEPYCSWIYKTEIPHATFNIGEDEDLYCVGMVFSINDLPQVPA